MKKNLSFFDIAANLTDEQFGSSKTPCDRKEVMPKNLMSYVVNMKTLIALSAYILVEPLNPSTRKSMAQSNSILKCWIYRLRGSKESW